MRGLVEESFHGPQLSNYSFQTLPQQWQQTISNSKGEFARAIRLALGGSSVGVEAPGGPQAHASWLSQLCRKEGDALKTLENKRGKGWGREGSKWDRCGLLAGQEAR